MGFWWVPVILMVGSIHDDYQVKTFILYSNKISSL